MEARKRTDQPLTLGQQLREARLRAGLKPKELARKAKLSLAAVYNCERCDRGGRVRTLILLAKALGLRLRIPDLKGICDRRGLTAAKIALMTDLAFDTVRSLLARPDGGNVRSLEIFANALGERVMVVI